MLLGAFAVGAAFGTKAGEGVGDRVRFFFTRNPLLYAAVAGLLAPRPSPRRSRSTSRRDW